MSDPEQPPRPQIDPADIERTSDGPHWLIVDIGRLALSEQEAFLDGIDTLPHHEIPVQYASLIGNLLTSEPEVAEPDVQLGSKRQFREFAVSAGVSGHSATRAWNPLVRLWDAVAEAKRVVPMLRNNPPRENVELGTIGSYNYGELLRLASLELRFMYPPDEGTSGEFSVDLRSLRSTLARYLETEESYKYVGTIPRTYSGGFGPQGVSLLARFVNAAFPDEEPLPTIPFATPKTRPS